MIFPVNARASETYTATLVDGAGQPVNGAILTTLTLTLYDVASRAVINARSGQNVLNANDVTVDSNGVLTWHMRSADNAVLGTQQLERHVALFTATWTDGGGNPQQLPHEVIILVYNLKKVA